MSNQSIQETWLDPKNPGAYSGISGFLKNEQYKDKKQVEEELTHLRTYSVHKPKRKNYKRPRVVVNFIDYIWGGDLIDYSKYEYQNSRYKFILVLVDIFSKYVWLVPLKNRKATTLRDALENMFKETGRSSLYLWFDQESGMKSSIVKKLLEDYNVQLYHTHSKIKSSFSERKIRDIKSRLERIFTETGKKRWLDVLSSIADALNSSYHRSIRMKPKDVNLENSAEVWNNLYSDLITLPEQSPSKFNVGDFVRVSVEKIVFAKSYEQNFSDEIFVIKLVKNTPPVFSYYLTTLGGEDVEGKFLTEELVLATPPQEN